MNSPTKQAKKSNSKAAAIKALGNRSIIFVGLMGAGKTAIGRGVAQALGLAFADSDHEIETVSRMTIPDLFDKYGEEEFRSLERRVIARLLKRGRTVISTGGGAFMNDKTRRAIRAKGISVWLKADLDTLMSRVMRKQNRPLLKTPDPRAVMADLIEVRYPVYGRADLTIISRDVRKEVVIQETVSVIKAHLDAEKAKNKHD